jgi:DNA-binding transcriptional LysR family regulator
LNIWCVPGFASQWLMARLGIFQAKHPGLDIEVRPTDKAPNFARHDADVDLRYLAANKSQDLEACVRSVEIARPAIFPVANPAFVACFRKEGLEAEDLLHTPLLHLHEDSDDEWRDWFVANNIDPGPHIPGPRLWHAHLTLDAARRGEGVALANSFLLGDDIATGRLAPLQIGKPVMLGSYMLFARKDRWDTPVIARFRRWLQKLAAEPSHES